MREVWAMLREQGQVIPSEADWGETKGDFDANDAKMAFLGRSNAEMQPEFKKQFMLRAQDLNWMPRVPFHYYMHGFTEYLISEDYEYDDWDDVVSGFYMDIVERRLSNDVLAIIPIADVVLNGLEFIRRSINNFDWDPEFHGSTEDVNKRVDKMIDQIRRLQNENGGRLKCLYF